MPPATASATATVKILHRSCDENCASSKGRLLEDPHAKIRQLEEDMDALKQQLKSMEQASQTQQSER